MDNEAKIKELEDELKIVNEKLDTTTTQLNKYLLKNTNYYETHKEEPKSTTDPEPSCCTKKGKKGENAENTAYTRDTYDNFIGIDPGVRALITSYDTNGNSIQVSTREYRHKSKMIYACKKRERWYKRWEHYDAWKAIPTIKTSKTSVMKEYFEYVFPKMQTFTNFHRVKGFRNLNFTSYCRSKATLASICLSIGGIR